MKSDLAGLYKLSLEERRDVVAEATGLDDTLQQALWGKEGLPLAQAEQMVENVVGTFRLPLGMCVYMKINQKDIVVPMVIEEPSVVAAASNASRMLRAGGGVEASSTSPVMIGQIQLVDVPDLQAAEQAILDEKEALLTTLRTNHPGLVRRGGGPQDLEVRHLPPMDQDDPLGPMLVVHILVDVCDAMGANAINTMCEDIAPTLAALSKGRARLRILSNLSDQRLVTVKGQVPAKAFCKKNQPLAIGIETAKGIEEASIFAERDPYRAATHNKGVMNGIDAVLMATGQDYRAIEAGAHAYASRKGRYTAMSRWRFRDNTLYGEMTVPMAVGIVGGITRVHPRVRAALEMMQIERAHELAEVAAAVGLAQNLAALRALAAEGIQQGHMRMHARNVAAEMGAQPDEIDAVVQGMLQEGKINRDTAKAILDTIRS